MVSKEEFNRYLDELMINDKGNKNLKHLTRRRFLTSEGYGRGAFLVAFLGLCCIVEPGLLLVGLGILGVSALLITLALIRITKTSNAEKHYVKYQSKIVEYLLKDFDYKLERYATVDQQVFLDSQFVGSSVTGYRGEDKLSINIPSDKGDYNLIFSDVVSFKEKQMFKGIFGYIELPHSFKCVLCINSTYEKEGLVFEPVELEDMEFNEKFNVLSDNQIEARYILTPDVMDVLLNLQEKVGRFKVAFADNRVYFGFVNMQLFKVDFVKGEEAASMFSGFYEPVRACMDVLNEVKKNKKIFKI